MDKKMKVCYFPGRESTYERNRVLVKGMEEAGLEVYNCGYPRRGPLRYLIGFLKFLYYKKKSDVIMVGFMGQMLVPIVRLLTRKLILFDAFVCAYQTLAFDRKSINPDGLIAKLVRSVERLSCQWADVVFLDTNQHIEYFIKEYKIKKNKFLRLWVGSDDSVMYPRADESHDQFLVHFHGEYQALHGARYIVEAAKLLPEISFQMIGQGKESKRCFELAKQLNVHNINFLPPVTYEDLSIHMAKASICLGIFGETQKTQMVIPLKVYEAMAMSKPIITADTPAIRELLEHQVDVYLCKAANPESLAQAIAHLKGDSTLRKKIADNGHKRYKNTCSPAVIGQEVADAASQLIRSST